MPNLPLVTVFIPTFNRLETLKVACRSVLEQGDFVILHVLDNASTDGTKEWLLEQAKKWPNIELTLRDENIGAVANYQEGFTSVKTKYCVPLASDDELLPGYLQKAIDVAKKNNDLGAIVFQTECRENDKRLWLNPPSLSKGRKEPREHIMEWAASGHYTSWSSTLWKTSALQSIEAATEFGRFPISGDAWIQFLCFLHFPVVLMDEPGAVLNIHDQQTSRSLGAGVVREFSELLQAMQVQLKKRRDLFSEEEVTSLMERLYEYWMNLIKSGFETSGAYFAENDIYVALREYLNGFYPHVGFKNFPLLPLFPEFRERKSDQSTAFQLQWMESSLSWKITKPLRSLADWLQRRSNGGSKV